MVLPFGGRVGRRRIPKESQVIEALFLLTGWWVWRGGGRERICGRDTWAEDEMGDLVLFIQ